GLEGHTDAAIRAGGKRTRADRAGIRLAKVTGIGPGKPDAADRQRGSPAVGQRHTLRTARRARLLPAKAHTARTQTDCWGGACRGADELVKDIRRRLLALAVGIADIAAAEAVVIPVIQPPAPLNG